MSVAVIGLVLLGCTATESEPTSTPLASLETPEEVETILPDTEEATPPSEEPATTIAEPPVVPASPSVNESPLVETEVHGKTLRERLDEASELLHTPGSGPHIRSYFPDIVLVYTDPAEDTRFPDEILPFEYYYSEEANTTFSICAIDTTVFLCDGKLERLITSEDIDSGRCEVTPIYRTDPRLGYSGYGAPDD